MLVEKVKKLSARERFYYWIEERYAIYQRRRRGLPKPWTDDGVLQNYFFTNPYRELDKVTQWFAANIRHPLNGSPAVLLATIIFRWFNYIPTGERLIEADLLERWSEKKALKILQPLRDKGEQIFTGAFMINSPAGEPKLEAICRRINNVWNDRQRLIAFFTQKSRGPLSLERAHRRLTEYEGLGGFMAYEVVCDLRYTYLLEKAPDKDTWCNPGPGAIRGLCRILGIEFEKGNNSTSPPAPKDTMRHIQDLLAETKRRFPDMPTFELREIEHSLCEYDKYTRALENDGRLKRKYNGAS